MDVLYIRPRSKKSTRRMLNFQHVCKCFAEYSFARACAFLNQELNPIYVVDLEIKAIQITEASLAPSPKTSKKS